MSMNEERDTEEARAVKARASGSTSYLACRAFILGLLGVRAELRRSVRQNSGVTATGCSKVPASRRVGGSTAGAGE